MPKVTVEFKPNGFPTARTYSPTWRRLESPHVTVGSWVPSILTTAISLLGSLPMMRPLNSRLSGSVTVTVLAPAITWLLVSTYPSGVTITPDPCPPPRRSRGSIGGVPNRRGPNGHPKSLPSGRRACGISHFFCAARGDVHDGGCNRLGHICESGCGQGSRHRGRRSSAAGEGFEACEVVSGR